MKNIFVCLLSLIMKYKTMKTTKKQTTKKQTLKPIILSFLNLIDQIFSSFILYMQNEITFTKCTKCNDENFFSLIPAKSKINLKIYSIVLNDEIIKINDENDLKNAIDQIKSFKSKSFKIHFLLFDFIPLQKNINSFFASLNDFYSINCFPYIVKYTIEQNLINDKLVKTSNFKTHILNINKCNENEIKTLNDKTDNLLMNVFKSFDLFDLYSIANNKF